jgi:hypothetical protein
MPSDVKGEQPMIEEADSVLLGTTIQCFISSTFTGFRVAGNAAVHGTGQLESGERDAESCLGGLHPRQLLTRAS